MPLGTESRLTFGKYDGFSLQEVYQQNPSYIKWMILNVDKIVIEPDLLRIWHTLEPKSIFTDDVIAANNSKYQKLLWNVPET